MRLHASVCVRHCFTSVQSPQSSSLLSSLSHSFPTTVCLYLAVFFITPFDDEKLIAVPGHETKRGRETESDGEWGKEVEGGLRDGWMEWVKEGKISALGALSWVETDRPQGWFLLLWLTPSLQCWDRQAHTLRHAQLVASWNILEGKSTKAVTFNRGAQILHVHIFTVGVLGYF